MQKQCYYFTTQYVPHSYNEYTKCIQLTVTLMKLTTFQDEQTEELDFTMITEKLVFHGWKEDDNRILVFRSKTSLSVYLDGLVVLAFVVE